MRRLLRWKPTGQYFQSLGVWTANPAEAHGFNEVTQAVNLVHSARLSEMELVLESQLGHVAAIPLEVFRPNMPVSC
jgi:hypothetical protein